MIQIAIYSNIQLLGNFTINKNKVLIKFSVYLVNEHLGNFTPKLHILEFIYSLSLFANNFLKKSYKMCDKIVIIF
jgi:hypothetical protein